MELSENQIKAIKAAVGHKGKKMLVTKFRPMSLNSYWSGGSRDYFFFVSPNGQVLRTVPQNGTPFDRLNLSCDRLEAGEILVQTSVIGGKTGTMRIFLPE